MGGVGAWILGIVMGLLAIFGLFMASHAVDGVFYFTGLLVFLFGVLFNFFLIAKAVGRSSGE